MLQAAAGVRSGLVASLSRCLTQCQTLAAPFSAGAVASFSSSSSSSSSSSVSEGSSNSPRPSSNDDRQDIDRYVHKPPPADGPVPTALEDEEIKKAAAGEPIFSAGDESEGLTAAAADDQEPATESMTAAHKRHQSASTKDFGGNPKRDEQPDPASLREGHAIPNESATTH